MIQVGGQSANTMEAVGGTGNCVIKQYGGSGPNIIKVSGGTGDDVIEMYGGPGNNAMTYFLTAGNDLVTILGGGGYCDLIIQKKGQNFTIRDYQGRLLFQPGPGGTTITVANLQRIAVIGDDGKTITYTFNAGVVPTAVTPLLLSD